MGVGTPDNAVQVEDRVKVDVQREAPDSDPFLRVSWLRSLIAGYSRRIFDFYQDLDRTEERVFPDTLDESGGAKWGEIYIGPENPETSSGGNAIATGSAGGEISIGETLTANSQEYTAVSSGTVSDNSINVLSITRTGTTATAITAGSHNLSSFVPVTISGAGESEYNLTDSDITVTGLDSFTYQVSGSPTSPATGTITAAYTSALIQVESSGFGDSTNLDADTPMKLGQPLANVDDTLYVDFGAVGGGADEESAEDYRDRRLDKIRNPVAHFNDADIIAKAKEVTGVTRVFVERAGTEIGTIAVTSITRTGNIAMVVTGSAHGFDSGQTTSITGAAEPEYNVTNARIIVEDSVTFYYVVLGAPSSPATGTITAATSIALGQVRVFFMRDNDANAIPTQSEVDDVKNELLTILPATTSVNDLIVSAPVAVPTDYTFTALTPNTATMRDAIDQNLDQFYEEQTTVGVDIDEDAYRAAIKNTVDPDTSDTVQSFELSEPVGDIVINSGQIGTKGAVTP